MAEKCKQQAKMHQNFFYRQLLNKIFLSSSGRLLKIQKLFIILTILKEIFFLGQNLNGLAAIQEGATCQCQTGACAKNFKSFSSSQLNLILGNDDSTGYPKSAKKWVEATRQLGQGFSSVFDKILQCLFDVLHFEKITKVGKNLA